MCESIEMRRGNLGLRILHAEIPIPHIVGIKNDNVWFLRRSLGGMQLGERNQQKREYEYRSSQWNQPSIGEVYQRKLFHQFSVKVVARRISTRLFSKPVIYRGPESGMCEARRSSPGTVLGNDCLSRPNERPVSRSNRSAERFSGTESPVCSIHVSSKCESRC